jgi:hypothetical protein
VPFHSLKLGQAAFHFNSLRILTIQMTDVELVEFFPKLSSLLSPLAQLVHLHLDANVEIHDDYNALARQLRILVVRIIVGGNPRDDQMQPLEPRQLTSIRMLTFAVPHIVSHTLDDWIVPPADEAQDGQSNRSTLGWIFPHLHTIRIHVQDSIVCIDCELASNPNNLYNFGLAHRRFLRRHVEHLRGQLGQLRRIQHSYGDRTKLFNVTHFVDHVLWAKTDEEDSPESVYKYHHNTGKWSTSADKQPKPFTMVLRSQREA